MEMISNQSYNDDEERPKLDNIEPCNEKEPFSVHDDVFIPAPINQYLRSYQRDGVCFLYEHFRNKSGCILADDMGLGKTIQVIAFFSAVMKKTGTASDALRKNRCSEFKFLVVAPTSVLYNWMDELKTWGYFRIETFHRQNKEEAMNLMMNGKVEILITTHETMRLYIDMLNQITWHAVIFDEAHKIKQSKSLVTKAAKELKSDCNIGLTGTPLQNNLEELWCLLDWANPGCLGTCDDFEVKFAKPICIGQRYNANKRELATARKKQQELNVLHRRWMVRRTKEMIKDQLPTKDEKIVFCSLSSLQVSMYETILKLPKVQRLMELDVSCHCGSGKLSKKCCLRNFNWRKWLFPYIQILLKTSNHSALLLPHHCQSPEQKELCNEICELLFEKYPALQDMYKHKKFSQMSDPLYCGKMLVLQKLLHVLHSKKDKVLLFSHSTQLLNIIEAYVMGRGMIYRRLDGETPAEKRNILVKEFNSDASVFICLLSTTAGSLGLNLTAANYVIIFDPLWNPTYDQQAQDRAYRIGQQRDVFVYRLISVGTIEENIYMRQIYKQQLANIAINTSNERRYFAGIQGSSKHRGELFGIANMFKFSSDHNSIFAKQTFEKVTCVENGVSVAKYEKPVKKSKPKDDTEKVDDHFVIAATQCIEEEFSDDGMDDVNKVKGIDRGNMEANILSDILGDCGVYFAHSTKSILGPSDMESKYSKQAMEDVFWDGMNSQQPANDANILAESNKEKEEAPVEETIAASSRIFERVGSEMFIIGCTPPTIQSRHFKNIAKRSGYDSEYAFAKYIIGCSNLDVNTLLKKLYMEKEPNISQISTLSQIYYGKEMTATTNKCKEDSVPKLLQSKKKRAQKQKIQRTPIRKPKHKKLDWNEIFKNELSDNDEITEYDSDSDIKPGERKRYKTVVKQGNNGDNKASPNSIPYASSSTYTKSKEKYNESPDELSIVLNMSNATEDCSIVKSTVSIPLKTFSTNSKDSCTLLKTTINTSPKDPPTTQKTTYPVSSSYSVLDDLMYSPIPSNVNDKTKKQPCTSKKRFDNSIEALLDHQPGDCDLDYMKMKSKCQYSSPSTLYNSDIKSSQGETMKTVDACSYLKNLKQDNDLSIIDELLDMKTPSYPSVSPCKKSKTSASPFFDNFV